MAEADPQKTFNVHDAKTHLSKLIDRAHAGEEIVLAKAGVPWARIVPMLTPAPSALPPRKGGQLKGLVAEISDAVLLEPCFTDEELNEFDARDERMGLF